MIEKQNTIAEQNDWARRRSQAAAVEKYARIAGTLLDAGVISASLPIDARQAYEAELQMLNQQLDQALLGIRETFAGVL